MVIKLNTLKYSSFVVVYFSFNNKIILIQYKNQTIIIINKCFFGLYLKNKNK